ncbi:MAG: ABC transporter permease, partial [Bacteroidales bacterium]|nr:ABC transporter permease [Bacteroidales bacterium]
MFELDNWMEIFLIIRKNKLKTFLTGFAVFWGIFMLIILLAAGNGFKNGVMSLFGNRAKNRIDVYGGRTSMPYQGLPNNRRIRLEQKDIDWIDFQVPESDLVSARITNRSRVTYEMEFSDCRLDGVYPEYVVLNGIKMIGNGRFINKIDMQEKRKVAVINKRLNAVLFKE